VACADGLERARAPPRGAAGAHRARRVAALSAPERPPRSSRPTAATRLALSVNRLEREVSGERGGDRRHCLEALALQSLVEDLATRPLVLPDAPSKDSPEPPGSAPFGGGFQSWDDLKWPEGHGEQTSQTSIGQ